MRKLFLTLLISVCVIQIHAQIITSPNGNLSLKFELTGSGTPSYQLSFKQKQVIKPSTLGLETSDIPSFTEGFTITKTDQISVNDTWNPVMGEQKTIRNNYNELLVTLTQKDQKDRFILIRFRIFNDGWVSGTNSRNRKT